LGRYSPLHADLRGLPTTLLATAGHDPLRDEGAGPLITCATWGSTQGTSRTPAWSTASSLSTPSHQPQTTQAIPSCANWDSCRHGQTRDRHHCTEPQGSNAPRATRFRSSGSARLRQSTRPDSSDPRARQGRWSSRQGSGPGFRLLWSAPHGCRTSPSEQLHRAVLSEPLGPRDPRCCPAGTSSDVWQPAGRTQGSLVSLLSFQWAAESAAGARRPSSPPGRVGRPG
jgi:hypothetical protein